MKQLICGILTGALLLFGSVGSGYARGDFHGHPGVAAPHRFEGHHGFAGHREFRPHRHFGAHVFIDPGFWGDPFYPDPYYTEPPVIAQPTSPAYWYYCQQAQAYYPYVTQCPGGWLTVVPPSDSPPPQGG